MCDQNLSKKTTAISTHHELREVYYIIGAVVAHMSPVLGLGPIHF